MDGFAIALSEITLVLFTTLAPSGAVAYLIMGLPLLAGRATGDAARRLSRMSCLPLVVAMVGLVASATHLGNPSNALYVFTGVGRSPLSTEVFFAVVFLALAGVGWLYSFAEHPRRWLQRALLAIIDVAIVAFVAAVAFAYQVDVIITWSLPLVPVALVLNALVGGPLIALVGFALADGPAKSGLLCAVAFAALVANTAVYGLLGAELQGMENALASVASLVPAYPVCVAAFAILGAAGIATACCAGRRASGRRRIVILSAGALLALAGIFVMRFVFYMTHLTVGLGV